MREQFIFGSAIKDYWQNILLFIPLGIGISVLAEDRRLNSLSLFLASLVVSAIASTTVEVTQIFLPSRVSNFSDIICNTLGGCLGASLYSYRRGAILFALGLLTFDRCKLSVKSLLKAIFGYCMLIFLAVWFLSANANLSNWENDFYLVLGNEVTGDRPWKGIISRCYIYDRAIPSSQIELVFQPLKGSDDFLTRLPGSIVAIGYPESAGDRSDNSLSELNLSWYSGSSSLPNSRLNSTPAQIENKLESKSGISLGRTHWLKSDRPATQLVRQLKSSQEFSIFLQVATQETTQTGPARIMTLSKNIYAHNLLIGQEGKDLYFRLRTPITGSQPTQPEFIIPNVFNSQNERQILITFHEKQLRFYVQNAAEHISAEHISKYIFRFAPATSFASYLPWNIGNWIINLETFDINRYRMYFYLAIALPIVFLIMVLIFLLA